MATGFDSFWDRRDALMAYNTVASVKTGFNSHLSCAPQGGVICQRSRPVKHCCFQFVLQLELPRIGSSSVLHVYLLDCLASTSSNQGEIAKTRKHTTIRRDCSLRFINALVHYGKNNNNHHHWTSWFSRLFRVEMADQRDI